MKLFSYFSFLNPSNWRPGRRELKLQNFSSELSHAGQTFCKFMNDNQRALGNQPRDLVRSKLIQWFKADLAKAKLASKRFMETDHGFIQWLFPLKTKGVNPQAPVINKQDHKVLRKVDDFKSKMMEHFLLFTEFMGLEYDQNTGILKKVNAKQWESWIEQLHNNLRISRILTSMKDFGLESVAKNFLDFLKTESSKRKDEVIDRQTFRQFADITRSSCENYWAKCL